jgi:drug/metabolite transporter (DMT)-like permease
VGALALALGASVAWGTSDFLGGMVSQRLPLRLVLLGAQLAGLAVAVLAWVLAGAAVPSPGAAAISALAGAAGLAGFACLYKGLATSAMAVVAPLAALAAVVPVAAGIMAGHPLGTTTAVGGAIALAGSMACAADSGAGRRRFAQGALLGLGAAVCFGAFFAALGIAAESAGSGAVLCNRVTSIAILVALLAVRPCGAAPRALPEAGTLVVLGALDVVADLGYAAACAHGLRPAVAMLASLYPLTTVLLARALLNERLGPARLAGAGAVVTGIALIGVT